MHYYSRQQADIIPKAVTGEQGSANGTPGEYKNRQIRKGRD